MGGAKATSRRLFLWPEPRAVAACGGGARKIMNAAPANKAGASIFARKK